MLLLLIVKLCVTLVLDKLKLYSERFEWDSGLRWYIDNFLEKIHDATTEYTLYLICHFI